MTEKLRTLLDEHASAPEFPLPDLERVRASGLARRRRRRVAVAGTAAAAAAVVALAVVLVPGRGTGDAVDPAAPPPAPVELPVTYAVGSSIHAEDGTRLVDVGHRIASYVQTRDGFVVARPDGRVSTVVGDDVTEVGRTDARDSRLVPDPASSLVGWVDPTTGAPAVVVLDLATGERETVAADTAAGMGTLADEGDPVYLYALDDRTAYLRDAGGAVAIDLDTGERRVVDPDARTGFDVLAARAGVVVLATDDGVALGPTRADAVPLVDLPFPESVTFSPDGDLLLAEADDAVVVVDVGTGERVPLGPTSPSFPVRWADDDTVLVLTLAGESSPVQLLSCSVADGACTVERDDLVDPAALESGFALPTGADYSG